MSSDPEPIVNPLRDLSAKELAHVRQIWLEADDYEAVALVDAEVERRATAQQRVQQFVARHKAIVEASQNGH